MSTELYSLRSVLVPLPLYKLSSFPSEDAFDNLLCAILDNNGVVTSAVPQTAQHTRIPEDREDSESHVDERHDSHLRNPVSLTRELLLGVSYVIAESCACPPHLALVRILQRLRKWRLIPLDEPEREASHVARLLADITNPPFSTHLDAKSTLERTSSAEIPRRLDGDAKDDVYRTSDQTNRDIDNDPSDVQPAPFIPPISPQAESSFESSHGKIISPCAHFRSGCSACCIPRPSSALALEPSPHQIEEPPCSSNNTVPGLIPEVPDSANCTDPDVRRGEPLYPKEGLVLVTRSDALLPHRMVSTEVFPDTENNGQTQITEGSSSKPHSRTPKTPKRHTPTQPRKPRNTHQRTPGGLSLSSSAYNASRLIPHIPSASRTPRQKGQRSIPSSESSVRVRGGENFNPGSTTSVVSNGRRDVLKKPTPTTPYKRTWRP